MYIYIIPKKSPAHSSAHTHGTPGYYGKSYTPEPDQVGTYHGAQYTWELPKQTNNKQTNKCTNGKKPNGSSCAMMGGKLRRSSKRSTRRRKRR